MLFLSIVCPTQRRADQRGVLQLDYDRLNMARPGRLGQGVALAAIPLCRRAGDMSMTGPASVRALITRLSATSRAMKERAIPPSDSTQLPFSCRCHPKVGLWRSQWRGGTRSASCFVLAFGLTVAAADRA